MPERQHHNYTRREAVLDRLRRSRPLREPAITESQHDDQLDLPFTLTTRHNGLRAVELYDYGPVRIQRTVRELDSRVLEVFRIDAGNATFTYSGERYKQSVTFLRPDPKTHAKVAVSGDHLQSEVASFLGDDETLRAIVQRRTGLDLSPPNSASRLSHNRPGTPR